MFLLRIFLPLCLVLLHAASGAMPAQDFNAKSASRPINTCASSYHIQSEKESTSHLFSIGIGLANSFEAETLVHTRGLTDSGYQKKLKRIADIQLGDEVLAWDEVKAFDIAQAKENLKLQANLQAKSAGGRQETCAECYENYSVLAAYSLISHTLR
jgi:hypothetical protein